MKAERQAKDEGERPGGHDRVSSTGNGGRKRMYTIVVYLYCIYSINRTQTFIHDLKYTLYAILVYTIFKY